ncbi:MAG TPA: DUF971 domain-containing protein [Candidatus Thalassarchaeaceae archaeon]|nr:MAG TPA: DUF971 domain-containing protein [Candidatus Poseidoniales archaeon]HII49130.1 DUF971 domain-containing protein [Candidatus Thalassarchaeaceae archaeon]
MADRLKELERADDSITLRYVDGDELNLPYHELRAWCPCAKCRPRWKDPHRRLGLAEEVKRLRVEMPKAEAVGRYAVRFTWTSGCSSGLWSFEHITDIALNRLEVDH